MPRAGLVNNGSCNRRPPQGRAADPNTMKIESLHIAQQVRNDDFARVGVPLMPVVAGEPSTRRQSLGYSLLLAPVSIAPAFTVAGGPVYLAVAVAANLAFLRCAWRVSRRSREQAVADKYRAEKKLFGVSIVYLFAIFAAFILEALVSKLVGSVGWPVWL